ncbi:leucine rich repeat LRR-containing protein [Nitzschia inconspicua]|uniref:Leucine rich repeat LRR-containing protein n=1 Tax=Nitzschia inconspicua TaxID=303405 RepID=A0A9K3KUP2_9STRA|nr:leucine rich repeat LRR-containing protein [Nitzschia inconspicua]
MASYPNNIKFLQDQLKDLRVQSMVYANRLAILDEERTGLASVIEKNKSLEATLQSMLDKESQINNDNNNEHFAIPLPPIHDFLEEHHASTPAQVPPSKTEQELMPHPESRNVLTIPTFPYECHKPHLKIDEKDFGHLQEILELRIYHRTSIHLALDELVNIDTSSGQYRVTSLHIGDETAEIPRWYDLPHLPVSLCNMDALKEIHVYHARLQTLFSEDEADDYMRVVPNLRILHLVSMSRLQHLPRNLGSFTSLEKLHLSRLPIDALPDSLSSLGTSLESITITDCENLTDLPNGFGQLHNLQHLEIKSTPIHQLPESFGDLKRLRHLDMDFQHLTQLPEGFKNLTNLQTLKTGEGTFHFSVPHLPSVEFLETSVSNLHQFDQTQTKDMHLHLRCCCQLTDEASVLDSNFDYLTIWSQVAVLHLDFLGYTPDYKLYEGFFSSVHQLQALKVRCHYVERDVYIDEVACLEKLKSIELKRCHLRPTHFLFQPPQQPNLEKISLSIITGGLELLPLIKAPCLKSLEMSFCFALDDAMFANLCTKWISHFESLHTMDVRGCSIRNIKPEHAQHLGKTDLRCIDLRYNPIWDGSDDELEKKLLPLVQHCHSLCDFGHDSEVPASVAYHLCWNSLRCLVLGGQRICSKGLWALILENATRGMSLVSSCNRHMSQAEVIYVLLKQRAAEELFGSLDVEGEDGKEVAKIM